MEVMTRTGNREVLDKESFWKEHQDTLVRIRNDLSSGKNSRSKFSPAGGIRKKTPTAAKGSNHPPYGKYRRTPSPYHLPKLSPQQDRPTLSPNQNGVNRSNKYDVVPPVKPKLAFSRNQQPDYDSWGEEEDEEDGEIDKDEIGDSYHNKSLVPRGSNSKRRYKPQPYTQIPQVVYGAPFPVYYPPPPHGSKGAKKLQARKNDRNRSYRDIHTARRAAGLAHSGIPIPKRKKGGQNRLSMPMYATPFPMMPMPMMYQPVVEEDEDDDDEDEIAKETFTHWQKHPMFAQEFTEWFIDDCMNTDIVPDFLIEILRVMKHMPYDHPLYVPSLYACEDLMSDHVSDLVRDVVREAMSEAASDLLDEQNLKRDPLEDFLDGVVEDVVREGVRETVRTAVVTMAQDYMEDELATTVIHDLVLDHLDDIGEELLEDTLFDIMAENFIDREVITSEVREESAAIAREVIQYYDSKVMKREYKEVSERAKQHLADSIFMNFMLRLVTQQGKVWTEDDYSNRFLDDMIFNTSMEQMTNVQNHRDKTLHSKPLQKLHERVVSDVALDVFLQQLTRSLDEDLADVDQWERGIMAEGAAPFPLNATTR